MGPCAGGVATEWAVIEEVDMDGLRAFFGSKMGLASCLLLAALGVYLLWTHTGHVLSALPYLILLACPLMHVFGHRHGDHKYRHHQERPAGE
jgi:hypothetical protein